MTKAPLRFKRHCRLVGCVGQVLLQREVVDAGSSERANPHLARTRTPTLTLTIALALAMRCSVTTLQLGHASVVVLGNG